jgi:hypothetical protein
VALDSAGDCRLLNLTVINSGGQGSWHATLSARGADSDIHSTGAMARSAWRGCRVSANWFTCSGVTYPSAWDLLRRQAFFACPTSSTTSLTGILFGVPGTCSSQPGLPRMLELHDGAAFYSAWGATSPYAQHVRALQTRAAMLLRLIIRRLSEKLFR